MQHGNPPPHNDIMFFHVPFKGTRDHSGRETGALVVSSRFKLIGTGKKGRLVRERTYVGYSKMVTFKASTCCGIEEWRRWDQLEKLVRTLSIIKVIKTIAEATSLRNWHRLKGFGSFGTRFRNSTTNAPSWPGGLALFIPT